MGNNKGEFGGICRANKYRFIYTIAHVYIIGQLVCLMIWPPRLFVAFNSNKSFKCDGIFIHAFIQGMISVYAVLFIRFTRIMGIAHIFVIHTTEVIILTRAQRKQIGINVFMYFYVAEKNVFFYSFIRTIAISDCVRRVKVFFCNEIMCAVRIISFRTPGKW